MGRRARIRQGTHHFSRRDESDDARHKRRGAETGGTIEREIAARLRPGRAGAVGPGKSRRLGRPDATHAHARDSPVRARPKTMVAPEFFAHLAEQFVARLPDVAHAHLRGITPASRRAHGDHRNPPRAAARDQQRLV